MTDRVREALIFSDLHLGWTVCHAAHERLVSRLAEAAGEADLIVMNGDIFDVFRGLPRARDADLAARFCAQVETWRSEGRDVVYIEGNHDPISHPSSTGLAPDRWRHDFIGWNGERVRVLHGHRFSEAQHTSPYDAVGGRFLAMENRILSRAALLRRAYRLGYGWVVGAWGWSEDAIWSRRLPGQIASLKEGCDAVVHGHFHFGPGHYTVECVPFHRSGAWVAEGHLGSVNRMLRYREGRFERLRLTRRGFEPSRDGR